MVGHPRYRLTFTRRLVNALISALVRLGAKPNTTSLLTTTGRRTGKPHTTPVTLVEDGGRRWLVAPYGPVSWVQNARAAGKVTLTRRRDTRQYAIREVAPQEAAPILKRYVRIAPATRRYFQATKDSPVEDFVTEADRHPVFELTPADENRQAGQVQAKERQVSEVAEQSYRMDRRGEARRGAMFSRPRTSLGRRWQWCWAEKARHPIARSMSLAGACRLHDLIRHACIRLVHLIFLGRL